MKYHPLQIVLLAFAPLLVRTALYVLACKFRSIHIKLLSCIVIAGSGVFLSIIPIPLPDFLSKALAIGLAMFLMTRYTEAELYPDVVFIPLIVEIMSSLITEFLLVPFAQ
ncbi:MAG: hypothetical protein ABSE41_02835 [Bacteroidota bacterium]|jgi:hypothetical protein